MSNLTRYEDPFANMVRAMQNRLDRNLRMFDDDSLFGRSWDDMNSALAVDVTSDDQNVIVKTAIPGVKEDDIKLDVNGNILTISAETRNEQENEQQNWHVREMRYGKYARSIRLPDEVKADQADATLDNGVLTVRLPKKQPTPVQNIEVKARKSSNGSNGTNNQK